MKSGDSPKPSSPSLDFRKLTYRYFQSDLYALESHYLEKVGQNVVSFL